jgi:CRISPR-associated protein Csx16
MPTKYFVTRHDGAILWAHRANQVAKKTTQLDVTVVQPGDIVIGTLPVHLASEVVKRGAKYWHLAMEVPEEFRGKELSADQMTQFGARLEEYRVLHRGVRNAAAEALAPTLSGEERLIHVVIASQQVVPNLLPALTLPCNGLCILVSDDASIQAAASLLGGIAKRHFAAKEDFEVIEYRFGDGTHFRDFVRQFTEARKIVHERWPGTSICLNVTGGTKPMALAATEAFGGGAYIVYCDTASNRIECIDPTECAPVMLNYDALTFELYLSTYRYSIGTQSLDAPVTVSEMEARAGLTGFLARNAAALGDESVEREILEYSLDGVEWWTPRRAKNEKKWSTILARLSQIGSGVFDEQGNKTAPLPLFVKMTIGKHKDADLWEEMLIRFAAANLIDKIIPAPQLQGASDPAVTIFAFKFRSPACARYVGGTWVEEFAGLTARRVAERAGLDPNRMVHMDVRLQSDSGAGGVKATVGELNQIDVAIYYQGRLLVLEAKVGGLSLLNDSQNVLNKLDRLKKSASGPFGTAWLLSARRLFDDKRFAADEARKQLVHRAEFYGIACHDVNRLATLHNALEAWLRIVPSKSGAGSPPIWSNENWGSDHTRSKGRLSRMPKRSTVSVS